MKQPSMHRLLLVEDIEHDVIFFRRACKKGGLNAEILHCGRAEEAQEILSRNHQIDLAIIDQGLPGMSGLDLCRQFLREERGFPLIILTGHGSEQLAVEALKSGVDDYLVKDPGNNYLELIPVIIMDVLQKHQDRLARRKAEDALRINEARLRKAQRIAGMGNWEWEIPENRIHLSEQMRRIFGVEESGNPLSSDAFSARIHPEDRQDFQDGINGSLKTGKSFVMEHRIVRPDGVQRILREEGEIDRNADQEPIRIQCVAQDITDRKMLEEELLRSKKHEAIGHLAGGIAHDFNNLFFAILGNLYLLKKKIRQGSDSSAYLNEMEQGLQRASDLIKKFITFSTGGSPYKMPISVQDVIDEIVSLSLSGSDVRYHIEAEEATPNITADRNQISQAFFNIIENAGEAVRDPDGRITIRIETFGTDGAPRQCPVSLKQNSTHERYVRITFADNGRGIRKEDLPKVFDP